MGHMILEQYWNSLQVTLTRTCTYHAQHWPTKQVCWLVSCVGCHVNAVLNLNLPSLLAVSCSISHCGESFHHTYHTPQKPCLSVPSCFSWPCLNICMPVSRPPVFVSLFGSHLGALAAATILISAFKLHSSLNLCVGILRLVLTFIESNQGD